MSSLDLPVSICPLTAVVHHAALRLALASATACFVSTPGGLSAARGSALWSSSGICRRSLRQTRSVAASVFGTRMQGGMAADEDDWYDSEKWESFKKSGARESGTRAAKDADASTSSYDSTRGDVSANVQREQRGGERQKGTNPNVEWLRIAGCDVCLPKDRKKPMDGQRFSGLVHFIGGAFVGTLPRQAYSVLIESLVAKGRLVVVATPCSGLAGMDHYKAAYEAAFKFQTACSVLRKDLGSEIFDADKLPTIGVAHSLGCKIQVCIYKYICLNTHINYIHIYILFVIFDSVVYLLCRCIHLSMCRYMYIHI